LVLRIAKQPVRGKSKSKRLRWMCRCDCGKVVRVYADALRRGLSKSCGCLHKDVGRGRTINETGHRYGRLLVLSQDNNRGKYKVVHWLCQCDCGKTVSVKGASLRRGYTESCGCKQSDVIRVAASGSNNYAWKGGKITDRAGYILIASPGHPAATKQTYVPEHRLVMEKSLGRFLREDEMVHHKNGVRTDNRLENLELCARRKRNHVPGQRISDLQANAIDVLRRWPLDVHTGIRYSVVVHGPAPSGHSTEVEQQKNPSGT